MKKTLVLLLVCVLSLTLLPVGALAAPAPVFEDVVAGAPYYDAVEYVAQNGFMTGVGRGRFNPDDVMTRAMLAAALYRLDGSKEIYKPVHFTDVSPTAWYSNAVSWAAASGIAVGYSNGAFGADDAVTRQQIVVMAERYAKNTGRMTDIPADLSAYSDASAIADWARGAMMWSVSEELFPAAGSTALLPGNTATRAETAAFLVRYLNGVLLEKRTSDFVSQFIKGDFGDFYTDSSDQLRQSITQDALLSGWNAILQVTGIPEEAPGSIYVRQNGYDVVVCTVAGTLYDISVTVTYGGDGKPAGLWTSIVPKAPPAPLSADKWEEIQVTVGEMALPGMLTLPKGAQKPPVVIMVQGSGASDMNEALGSAPNRPFEDIARGLADQGVATLRYNKRTYQYPAGRGDTIQYEVLDDAAAAVQLLMNESRVDANRIYLLGHSLGGMMAPKITADNPQIKGFISMAGSLRPLQDIVMDQNKAVINAQASLTDQQKKDMLTQVETEIEKTRTLDDGGTGSILNLPTNYWKSLNAIDNMAIIKNLNVPMLILQGSADFQVYPDKDFALWQKTLEGRSNVTLKLYDGLSHLFMPNQFSPGGVPDVAVYNAPNHVEVNVTADIASWISKQ